MNPVSHLKPLLHTTNIRICTGICHSLMSPNDNLVKLCSYLHASYLFWLLIGIEILYHVLVGTFGVLFGSSFDNNTSALFWHFDHLSLKFSASEIC